MATQAVIATLGGCVGCQAGVELLQREVKNSLNLLTFATFIFISLEGLIFQSKFFSIKQQIPTRAYLTIVVLFFIVNLCNNYALHFDIYFPLLIIFKSGSLLANIIMGRFLRNHIYTIRQIFSVVIVTGGIVIFTLASYDTKHTSEIEGADIPELLKLIPLPIPSFFIGIILLSIALILSAYLGVCQEDLYRMYGKHSKEAMFYVHFLSLPGFALLGTEIREAIDASNKTPQFHLFGYGLLLPTAWVYILIICVLQWVCINNVYSLSALTSSLNVTMVISLRKFLSLFLSFVVFHNPFNMFHIFGAIFVFIGSLMFSRVL